MGSYLLRIDVQNNPLWLYEKDIMNFKVTQNGFKTRLQSCMGDIWNPLLKSFSCNWCKSTGRLSINANII